ncbi:MAG: elongation factor P--(R)-beta-lysine ligase [Spirochaetes bacterium]|nr:elongation factor P--(R)-beta-lysine ligase [Spirochaetota bacterium]
MQPDLRARLSRSDRFTREIREFFAGNGYVEVDTPCLTPFLIPEPAIEVFSTAFHPAAGGSVEMYLAPSPELWMKRLIAAGSGSIFQMAKSFRNGDLGGRLHNPEFRLLEWYTVGASCHDQIATTEELVSRLLSADPPETHAERLGPPFRVMTMQEAFRDLAGMDLARCMATGDLIEAARSRGADARDDWTWEQAFHGVFLAAVEPRLPRDRPLVLTDWPAQVPTTARRRPGTPWAERWELYLDGVEVANCYTEETDPREVDRFMADEARRQRDARVVPRVDEGYGRLFAGGFPDCAGVALGVDRLEMVFRGERSLEGVINFPLSAIVRG